MGAITKLRFVLMLKLIITVHEGESSAAPVPSAEKWSHEAIVTRSNMRPERMQKLKPYGEFGAESGCGWGAGEVE
ncbi:hypothetical protein [Nostoc sp. UHCC 0252]|uniref:hypothetical protein n=1 Tax=Nostoc sp. UHCC 0252 TaxID=3110241 RepID=UPI002B213ECF|nr:hypothetical protein [Nostoc sp. UHCC 0252]MEA5605531.1 hypothetical protein [Nostoc sp. UHCC 0252]